MKRLSNGNSFSDDAQRYLHEIAANRGVEIETLNVCIGGCSLENHANKIKSGERAYLYHYNGDVDCLDDKRVTIEEGITMREWDVVTIQQVSTHSFKEESFYPYIHEVVGYVREKLPKAKIYVHETWAYEWGSPRSFEITDGRGSEFMLNGLRHAYKRAKDEIGADGIIPSGELMELLRLHGAQGIYRDTFHAGYGLGRYALGLLWFKLFTGMSVLDDSFTALDVPATEEDLRIARECAESLSFE